MQRRPTPSSPDPPRGRVLMIVISLNLLIGPLRPNDQVPFIGGLFSSGLRLITFVLGVALTAVIVGVAWIVARPLLGIVLLGCALISLIGVGALVFMGVRKMRAQPRTWLPRWLQCRQAPQRRHP